MKSLSSSRREVLVDCFHVYTYHIGYLLPGSAVIKYPMRPCSPAAAKPERVLSTIIYIVNVGPLVNYKKDKPHTYHLKTIL